MTSTPTTVRKHRNGWLALVITVLARATLTVLLSLLGWSMAPALLGWHPTVVMTGSMLPHLVPGDVVVSRPIDATQVRIGQVLLVDSPDRPGELRMHRLVRISSDGKLILRGDANPNNDSTPVARSAVHGVGALRIPKLGLPYLWVSTGRTGPLVLTGLALALLVAVARWWRPLPAPAAEAVAAEDPAAEDPPAEDPDSAGPKAAAGPPSGVPAVAVGAGRTSPWRRGLIVLVTVAVLVAVTAGGADALAPYSGKATNPTDTWTAGTYFKCANAVTGDSAAFALPLSEASGSVASDLSGNADAGTYSATGVTYAVTGPCTHDSRTAVTLDGSTGSVRFGSVPSSATFTVEIWFKATSASHGGMLVSTTNSSGNKVRVALAMTSAGKLTLAAGASTTAVTTAGAYNNNAWHLAVGVITVSGIALYVDAQTPVTLSATTSVTGQNGPSYAGFGDATGLGTGSYNYFQGSIAFVAMYTSAFTATQVAAHYAAAT